MFALNSPRPMSKSLRVLAALLAYPDAQMRDDIPEMRDLLADEAAVSQPRRAEIDVLLDTLQHCDPLETEAAYVEAVRPQPRHVAAPVRACSRRLA